MARKSLGGKALLFTAAFCLCGWRLAAQEPDIVWSTFLGGSDRDAVSAVLVDQQGGIYVTGETLSADFPTRNAFDADYSGGEDGDAFVSKFAPDGSLLWSTYLGGTGSDGGQDIDADSSGNIYVTGLTESVDFPATGWYDDSYNGQRDAFLTKLSPEGSLLESTYLGGQGPDEGHGICVDEGGSIALCGSTLSADFPPEGYVIDPNNEEPDAFVARLKPDGELLWSAFTAEYRLQSAVAVEVSGTDEIYYASDNRSCPFVAKVNSVGEHVWRAPICTGCISGDDDGENRISDLLLDGSGDPLLLGRTECRVIPPYGFRSLGWHSWLRSFRSDGTQRSAMPLGPVCASGLATDRNSNFYTSGWSTSHLLCFPPPEPYCWEHWYTEYGGADICYWNYRINTPAPSFQYLGGGGDDFGYHIATDGTSMVYVVGATAGFPMENGFDTTYNGNVDGFILAVTAPPSPAIRDPHLRLY